MLDDQVLVNLSNLPGQEKLYPHLIAGGCLGSKFLGLVPTTATIVFFHLRHAREGLHPKDLPNTLWMPAFAGMTRRKFF